MGAAGDDHHGIPKSILEFLESKGKNCNPLWRKVLEVQAKKRCLQIWNQRVMSYSFNGMTIKKKKNPTGSRRRRIRSSRNSSEVMKISSRRSSSSLTTNMVARTLEEGCSPAICIVSSRRVVESKVRALKKLIPNGESMEGLDGLFRETADYILALQMRVNLMQIMVKELSA